MDLILTYGLRSSSYGSAPRFRDCRRSHDRWTGGVGWQGDPSRRRRRSLAFPSGRRHSGAVTSPGLDGVGDERAGELGRTRFKLARHHAARFCLESETTCGRLGRLGGPSCCFLSYALSSGQTWCYSPDERSEEGRVVRGEERTEGLRGPPLYASRCDFWPRL